MFLVQCNWTWVGESPTSGRLRRLLVGVCWAPLAQCRFAVPGGGVLVFLRRQPCSIRRLRGLHGHGCGSPCILSNNWSSGAGAKQVNVNDSVVFAATCKAKMPMSVGNRPYPRAVSTRAMGPRLCRHVDNVCHKVTLSPGRGGTDPGAGGADRWGESDRWRTSGTEGAFPLFDLTAQIHVSEALHSLVLFKRFWVMFLSRAIWRVLNLHECSRASQVNSSSPTHKYSRPERV